MEYFDIRAHVLHMISNQPCTTGTTLAAALNMWGVSIEIADTAINAHGFLTYIQRFQDGRPPILWVSVHRVPVMEGMPRSVTMYLHPITWDHESCHTCYGQGDIPQSENATCSTCNGSGVGAPYSAS